MRCLPVFAVAATSLCVAMPAAASTFTYTLSDDSTIVDQIVTPFSTATSAEDFYRYGIGFGIAASANVLPPLTLVEDQALFFLHENSTTGDLSFGVFLDAPVAGDTVVEEASFTVSGAPASATIAVGDDAVEIVDFSTANQTYSFRWLPGRTDGFAAEGFEDLPWMVSVSDFQTGGLTSFAFLGADGSRIALDGGDITLQATPVPLPASAPLVAAGIGALVALRRRKRS